MTEAVTEAATQALTEAVTEAVKEAVAQALTEAATEAATEAVTDAVTEAATEARGLRERKKDATRLALHRAALRLAAEHGLDRVTVEAIADAANVSRRTFSNYFSGKEEAFFYGDALRLRRLLRLIRDQAADELPWTALSRAAEQLIIEEYGDSDPAWLAQRRQLRTQPGLLPHHVAAYAVFERELAAELLNRLSGPDEALRSRVMAATFLAAVRVGVQHWIVHPDLPLPDTVRAALADATPAPWGRT